MCTPCVNGVIGPPTLRWLFTCPTNDFPNKNSGILKEHQPRDGRKMELLVFVAFVLCFHDCLCDVFFLCHPGQNFSSCEPANKLPASEPQKLQPPKPAVSKQPPKNYHGTPKIGGL